VRTGRGGSGPGTQAGGRIPFPTGKMMCTERIGAHQILSPRMASKYIIDPETFGTERGV
jgi:hypothetical protein